MQFLICLYFVKTINKSKSQPLDMVKIDLQSLTFIYNQLYIIFSQFINVLKLYVLFLKQKNKKTINIMYLKVFF